MPRLRSSRSRPLCPETPTSGADLPWTRAGRPFEDGDLDLIRRVLGPDLAEAALHRTAAAFYRA